MSAPAVQPREVRGRLGTAPAAQIEFHCVWFARKGGEPIRGRAAPLRAQTRRFWPVLASPAPPDWVRPSQFQPEARGRPGDGKQAVPGLQKHCRERPLFRRCACCNTLSAPLMMMRHLLYRLGRQRACVWLNASRRFPPRQACEPAHLPKETSVSLLSAAAPSLSTVLLETRLAKVGLPSAGAQRARGVELWGCSKACCFASM